LSEASSFEFPCDFPLKIMGRRDQMAFQPAVFSIVQKHAPDFDSARVQIRTSRDGNYLSLSCDIRATSRAQLDALWRELSACPWVKYVL